ncbi:type II toxin-antitoxin system VapC family toxin [Anaerosoma tenue]|uniref:type II toxin-antitoxin system VapC family toxin n=1 Tax=Anaerosoma tenue TaxID=2933588 RepID=UPI002260C499|nr:type II toxin-antitoxin system VapC family toxin [Anaerosoma tenue]MCK8114100.1 type II toxin-antitoxin system VapC family toxin [Anaerosoma tenue]
MNVVDSSAWLEYFGDGPNAEEFALAVEDTEDLVVPALTLFEVFKRTFQIADESTALDAVGVMMQGTVVDLSASLALDAARLSLESGLAMADAIILATARSHEAVLWTQDAHFDGVDGVEFRPKR